MKCLWRVGFFSIGVFLAALLLLCSATVSFGQSAAFATITGRALDPKGESVPNAAVTATNTETGIVRTTQTTSDGLYRFDNLPSGVYNVAIEASGFAKAEAQNVKLQVGEIRDVNFNLELAGQKQSVLVTSELPLIETTKTDTSTVIDDKSVANLPTTTSYNAIGGVANDYQGLAASAPGVRYDYTGLSSDIVGPGAINSRGITVNLDGGDISDQLVSSRDALGASVEEVKEFQVLTNNYNAEYGQAGNVILNVITKSGTNSVHGDFHSYFRGRNLGASDFFYNQTSCDPTITGDGSCDNPTDAGFPTHRAPFHKHEYGFTVGGPFVKDRLFWFGSWEKVQQGSPATFTPFGNSVTVNQPTNEILGSGKVDARLTDKHTLTIRYNLQRDLSDNLLVQTGPNTDPTGLVSSVVHDNGLNIGMVSTPTPHTVNEARFFWHRFLSQTPTKSSAPGQALPKAYVGADFCCPQGALQQRFQYIDNLSWSRGAHTMKVGVNISHFPYDSLFQQFHFGRYENFKPGGCVDTTFPLGNGQCPTSFTTGAGPGFVHAADTIYGAYIQDTWQIRQNLTLNYGLRYDIESGAFKGGTLVNNDVPGGCTQSNGLIPACGSDTNNWQPRVGIAWTPGFESGILHRVFGDRGKSVIRASAAEITEMAYLNVVLDSLNFDGRNLLTANIKANDCFQANGSLNPSPADPAKCAVIGSFPNAPSAASLQPFTSGNITNFGRVRPISPTIKNPEIRMASLTIQRQIGPSFTFSIGYQGVFGFGLFGETDTNFPTPILDTSHTTTPSGAPAKYFYLPDRPSSQFGAVRTNFSNRTSAYHSLVFSAQKRLSHHYQFQGSYTFSKTLGTGEDFFGLSEPADPLASLSLDRARSQQDIRHLGNFSVVIDSNNLIGTPYLKQVINNWTIGLISSLQSGRPYPVSTGDGALSGSAFPALGAETNQRPNICTAGSSILGCVGAPVGALVATNIASTSGSNLAVSQNGVAACNNPAIVTNNPLVPVLPAAAPNCSALQTTYLAPAGASASGPIDSFTGDPVDFQFISGNLDRNAGNTLALYRFDISLQKAFKIPKWESSQLEFKLDVFNLFNHPLLIGNDGNDVLNFLSLPSLTVPGKVPDPNNPGKFLPVTNAGFNTCTAGCVNPFTGLYLGLNGQPLTLQAFTSGRVDKDLNPNKTNFLGLGNPAANVSPRIMQLSIRFRW